MKRFFFLLLLLAMLLGLASASAEEARSVTLSYGGTTYTVSISTFDMDAQPAFITLRVKGEAVAVDGREGLSYPLNLQLDISGAIVGADDTSADATAGEITFYYTADSTPDRVLLSPIDKPASLTPLPLVAMEAPIPAGLPDGPDEQGAFTLYYGGGAYTATIVGYDFAATPPYVTLSFETEETLLHYVDGQLTVPVVMWASAGKTPTFFASADVDETVVTYYFKAMKKPAEIIVGPLYGDEETRLTLTLETPAEAEIRQYTEAWDALPAKTRAGVNGKVTYDAAALGKKVQVLGAGGYLWYGDTIYYYDDPGVESAELTPGEIGTRTYEEAIAAAVLLQVYPPKLLDAPVAEIDTGEVTYRLALTHVDLAAKPATVTVLVDDGTPLGEPLQAEIIPPMMASIGTGDAAVSFTDSQIGERSVRFTFPAGTASGDLTLQVIAGGRTHAAEIPMPVKQEDLYPADVLAYWNTLPGEAVRPSTYQKLTWEEIVASPGALWLETGGYLLKDDRVYRYYSQTGTSGRCLEERIGGHLYEEAIEQLVLVEVYPSPAYTVATVTTTEGKALEVFVSNYRFAQLGKSFVTLEVFPADSIDLPGSNKSEPVIHVVLEYGDQYVDWSYAEWAMTWIEYQFDATGVPDAVYVVADGSDEWVELVLPE